MAADRALCLLLSYVRLLPVVIKRNDDELKCFQPVTIRYFFLQCFYTVGCMMGWTPTSLYKSSAVAEMGDRGHSRHWPKRGGGAAVSL